MQSERILVMFLAGAVLALSGTVVAETPYEVDWYRQFGTSEHEYTMSVTLDSAGGLLVSGWTYGDLSGPNAGGRDAYLSRYDSAGDLLWTRQFGTAANDAAYGACEDGLGNVYITGATYGALGGPHQGVQDIFVGRYDLEGNQLWMRQLGTGTTEHGYDVVADDLGNVFVTGNTFGPLDGINDGSDDDAFICKYNATGDLLWTRELARSTGGGRAEEGNGIATDGLGNVYVSGFTFGSVGGPNAGLYDAFVTKYDALGNMLWTRQIGSSASEFSWHHTVTVDSHGNVYLAGNTEGDLDGPNAGGSDAFLCKYDSIGDLIWKRQWGTDADDTPTAIELDANDYVYVTGVTKGDLAGPNAGDNDGFAMKFSASGDILWMTQFGSDAQDVSGDIAVDSSGNLYIAGDTLGNLGGVNAGMNDGYFAKLVVPEPAVATLLALGGPALLRKRKYT